MTYAENATLPLVLVDDEPSVLLSTRTLLESSGIRSVETLQDGRELLPFLEKRGASVIVLDLIMPELPGVHILRELVLKYPHIPVLVMTAVHDLETAVVCMKEGAFDYLVKPVDNNRFLSCVQRAMELQKLRNEVNTLKDYLLLDRLDRREAFASLLARSRKMRAVFQYVEAISASPEPVLVTGETGVGKELISQAIHQLSERPGPLISINVAGLDEVAFSDTLFGHKKGAFTGAEQNRAGLIAQAEDGSLFLDEIGDLNAGLQLKLLRLLQEKKYYPLGSDIPRSTNTRFICATNRDLEQTMAAGEFRPDLYYRLAGHQIHLPPLRERKEDIPLLVMHFLEEAAQSMNRPIPSVPQELFTLLNHYAFPGNVRELRGMVFDAMAQLRGNTLSMKTFRTVVLKSNTARINITPSSNTPPFHFFPDPLPSLEEAELHLIQEALKRCHGNQSMAAMILGTSRQTLNRKLKKK